jgi:hypothetical protein
MSLGLAAVGGFMGRRKEVIDASRKRQGEREDLKEEIGLRTAGRIEAETTINADTFKLEAEDLSKKIFALAGVLKRNKNLDLPVGDIAVELGMRITDESSLRTVSNQISQGFVNVGKRGLTVSTSTTVTGNMANAATMKLATEFIKKPNDSLLLGITQANPGMSKDEAEDLLGKMTGATELQVISQLASRAAMGSKSGQTNIFGDPAQTAAFGKNIGSQLMSEPGLVERWTGWGIGGETKFRDTAASPVTMPNKRPSSTTVGADGTSSTGGRPFPKEGEIVQPINPKTGAPSGPPFQYTGKGTDPYNLGDANNWIDPATGRPPTPTQMR